MYSSIIDKSERYDCSLDFSKSVSLTKQSMADDCDINKIMDRYASGAMVDHVNQYQGNYGDFTGAPDYHESMNKIIAAQDAFESLPAKVRAKFANDPGQFVNFVSNEENIDEMIELGLMEAPEAPQEPSEPPATKKGEKPAKNEPETQGSLDAS